MADRARQTSTRLQAMEQTQGTLPPLLQFFRRLVTIQGDTGRKISTAGPVFSPGTVRARALDGRPLLEFEDLALDWPLLRQTYSSVLAVFASYPDLFGALPAGLVALTPGRVVNRRTVRAWFRGRKIVLPAGAAEPPALLNAIFQAALQPFLARQAAALAGQMDQDIWRRGYCPACGGNPDFSYLTRDTSARWLACPRCDTEWLYQRVQCPYCGNADQNQLSFLTDERGRCRLYVCDACRGYLKAVDLRQTEGDLLVPLERVLTLDMDRQAQAKGYHPPQ